MQLCGSLTLRFILASLLFFNPTVKLFSTSSLSPEGRPYTLIDKVTTDCEYEALSVGTRLADRYASFDEQTEWDMRIHHEYLVKHLGFAGWIQMGLWPHTELTAEKRSAPRLHKRGGWAGQSNITESSYWPLQNKWLYMMGDSTQRQIWATFVSPFQNNNFERNAKEWSRENCARQFPRRKEHPSDGWFPEEGWGGRCGNNEVTCHLSGFGPKGRISFDWKHFTWEDYDEWLFGREGLWNSSIPGTRHPDILVIHVGLHTCAHAIPGPSQVNKTMIRTHEAQLVTLMENVRRAVDRTPPHRPRTMVIIQLPGRAAYGDPRHEHCSRHFNRLAAYEAHRQGFPVFYREEIERRILYKSEYWEGVRYLKPLLHLENPGPNIIGTALLSLVGCLLRNGSDFNTHFRGKDVL